MDASPKYNYYIIGYFLGKVRNMGDLFKIGDIAEILDVSTKTLKNWEAEGKIPKADRNKWDWRVYNQEQKDKLIKIVKDNNFFVETAKKDN